MGLGGGRLKDVKNEERERARANKILIIPQTTLKKHGKGKPPTLQGPLVLIHI